MLNKLLDSVRGLRARAEQEADQRYRELVWRIAARPQAADELTPTELDELLEKVEKTPEEFAEAVGRAGELIAARKLAAGAESKRRALREARQRVERIAAERTAKIAELDRELQAAKGDLGHAESECRDVEKAVSLADRLQRDLLPVAVREGVDELDRTVSSLRGTEGALALDLQRTQREAAGKAADAARWKDPERKKEASDRASALEAEAEKLQEKREGAEAELKKTLKRRTALLAGGVQP